MKKKRRTIGPEMALIIKLLTFESRAGLAASKRMLDAVPKRPEEILAGKLIELGYQYDLRRLVRITDNVGLYAVLEAETQREAPFSFLGCPNHSGIVLDVRQSDIWELLEQEATV